MSQQNHFHTAQLNHVLICFRGHLSNKHPLMFINDILIPSLAAIQAQVGFLALGILKYNYTFGIVMLPYGILSIATGIHGIVLSLQPSVRCLYATYKGMSGICIIYSSVILTLLNETYRWVLLSVCSPALFTEALPISSIQISENAMFIWHYLTPTNIFEGRRFGGFEDVNEISRLSFLYELHFLHLTKY